MLPTDIGKQYQADICPECQEKIREETAKLGKLDLLRWKKTAFRFADLLCKDCKLKMVKKAKRKYRRV